LANLPWIFPHATTFTSILSLNLRLFGLDFRGLRQQTHLVRLRFCLAKSFKPCEVYYDLKDLARQNLSLTRCVCCRRPLKSRPNNRRFRDKMEVKVVA